MYDLKEYLEATQAVVPQQLQRHPAAQVNTPYNMLIYIILYIRYTYIHTPMSELHTRSIPIPVNHTVLHKYYIHYTCINNIRIYLNHILLPTLHFSTPHLHLHYTTGSSG